MDITKRPALSVTIWNLKKVFGSNILNYIIRINNIIILIATNTKITKMNLFANIYDIVSIIWGLRNWRLNFEGTAFEAGGKSICLSSH
jgi:hypothetical protein